MKIIWLYNVYDLVEIQGSVFSEVYRLGLGLDLLVMPHLQLRISKCMLFVRQYIRLLARNV